MTVVMRAWRTLTRRGASKPFGIIFGIVDVDGWLTLCRSAHPFPDFGRHIIIALHRRTRFHRLEPAHEIGESGVANAAIPMPFAPWIGCDVGNGVFVAREPWAFGQ